MKKMIQQCALLCTLLCATVLKAQTDYTSSITNPSFESGVTGWTNSGLSTQGNTAFTLKAGSTYMEKWTARGGAVGSASVSQQLTTLPPGSYELSVAAQNIQEDTPAEAQTGAYIFADEAQTTVTVRNTYTVAFTHISGSVTIGFEAAGASGNWIAVDNFTLTLVGDLSTPLSDCITEAETLYGDGSGTKAAQLLSVITSARSVRDNGSATAQQQADAIIALREAQERYRCANASVSDPIDLTSSIANPSFEEGDFTGWTNSGLSLQSNTAFGIKDGTYYAERWVSKGSAVGSCKLSQVMSGMRPGRYHLNAAAQNIQEDTPGTARSGASIFANSHRQTITTRSTYTLDFVLVSERLTIGFEAANATGNWLSVDDFTLEYVGEDFNAVKSELESLINDAEELVGQRMDGTIRSDLQDAVDEASALLSQTDAYEWGAVAANLEDAIAVAESSAEIFSNLAQAIEDAQTELSASSADVTEDYETAIDAAQGVYDNAAATDAMASLTIDALAKASFAFRVVNGTGTPPTVVTDTRFVRGNSWAFGRSTVTGSNIIEQGFCWSEDPDPKVTDNRTTEYLSQSGNIYWLRDLKPATMYYMRAYAINRDYAVGYGDVIKFSTVPKGTITHWYNNGGDEATNDRINYAINTAMDYYWNNLTSIHDFGISVTYSPGTPTADCSYGGSMRMGSNSSYQKAGTIMHESLHGIGVGTHGIWWSADMRANVDRGAWLGDRVTEAVRFWDNDNTAVITGDNTHLWPYGCNGAGEDNGSDNLYCMMGILAQALNEDGLPGSSAIGYALPYYSFNHEDGVKYYIKNEDESRGLHTSYLVETASHQLQWKTMTADEAAADDAAAWYLSFTPGNQYYQLRNAKTGYYMTYASGFATANHATPTSADNIHLMRGRVDVSGHRGYYFIHPESSANPPALTGNANGATASSAWSISTSATTQRWLILTAEEAGLMNDAHYCKSMQKLDDILTQIRQMAETSHTETVEGTDALLTERLADIEAQALVCEDGDVADELIRQARTYAMQFLMNVEGSDDDTTFDVSFMLENPDFSSDDLSGWTVKTTDGYSAPTVNTTYKDCEFFEKKFEMSQTMTGMKKGTYEVSFQAFQRPGANSDALLAAYKGGTWTSLATLKTAAEQSNVPNIYSAESTEAIFPGTGESWPYDLSATYSGTKYYVPNSMEGARRWFDTEIGSTGVNYYTVTASAACATNGGSMSFGFEGDLTGTTAAWLIFANFKLKYVSDDVPVNTETTEALIADARALLSSVMGDDVKDALQDAIDALDADKSSSALFTALETAVDNAQTSIDRYAALLTAIENAEAYTDYRPQSSAAQVTYQYGIDAAQEVYDAHAVDDCTTAIANLTSAVNASNVDDYTAYIEGYAYSYGALLDADLRNWETSDWAMLASGQHWSGATQNIYEQAGSEWASDSGWSHNSTQTVILPAGHYVVSIIARAESRVASTMTVTVGENEPVTTVLTHKGDVGRGVNTSGVATYEDGQTYANDGVGRGWEYRFLPFTVEGGDTPVTISVQAVSTSLHTWVSLSAPQLRGDIHPNCVLISANKGDLTSMIESTFDEGTGTWTGGNRVTGLARSWRSAIVSNAFYERTSSGTMSVTLADMPAGTYKVVAVARAAAGCVITPQIAGTNGAALTGVGDARVADSGAEINYNGVEMPYSTLGGFTTNANGHNWKWITATGTLATDGSLVISFNCNASGKTGSGSWMPIDDVHLYCTHSYNGTGYTRTVGDGGGTINTDDAVVTADIVVDNPNTVVRTTGKVITASGNAMYNNQYSSTRLTRLVLYDGHDFTQLTDEVGADDGAILYRQFSANTWATLTVPFWPTTALTMMYPTTLTGSTLSFEKVNRTTWGGVDKPMLVKSAIDITAVEGQLASTAAGGSGVTHSVDISSGEEETTMHGVYGNTPGKVPVSTSTALRYVVGTTDNTLHQVTGSNVNIKPFRAYFELDNSTGGEARRSIIMNFDGNATGIDFIEERTEHQDVTTMSDGKYAENGRIVVVKNGVKYNISGQVIR